MKTTSKPLDKQAVENYLLPELENIKALLKGLKLTKSLQALIFLQNIVKYELQNISIKISLNK